MRVLCVTVSVSGRPFASAVISVKRKAPSECDSKFTRINVGGSSAGSVTPPLVLTCSLPMYFVSPGMRCVQPTEMVKEQGACAETIHEKERRKWDASEAEKWVKAGLWYYQFSFPCSFHSLQSIIQLFKALPPNVITWYAPPPLNILLISHVMSYAGTTVWINYTSTQLDTVHPSCSFIWLPDQWKDQKLLTFYISRLLPPRRPVISLNIVRCSKLVQTFFLGRRQITWQNFCHKLHFSNLCL